ncbi:hypothetical protein JCM8547_008225 [Rhodosporidiobolus lusitaniae]
MAVVPNLAVLVLLGGRSTRMGTPKHQLPHPLSDRPLLAHHLDVLTQLQEEGVFPGGVYVSAREDQKDGLALPEGVDLVLDDPARNGDIGPASGILQAFHLKPNATWLLLAVDLPFLDRSSILHLLQAHSSPVSLFLHPSDGNPEPLFSVWTRPALEQLEKNCKAGKNGPCRAAKDVWGGKIVEGKGGVKVLQENWVKDADTPEEWEKAVAALSKADETAPVVLPPTPPLSPTPALSLSPSQQPDFRPKKRQAISLSTALERIRRLSLRPLPVLDVPDSSFSSSTNHSPSPPAPLTLPIVEATGSLSAFTVRAILPHPLHDNSAMDGYAVPSSLLSSASSLSPVFLPVLGRIVAGDSPPPPDHVEALGKEGCWEVMTGSVFPADAFDAVVKVEDAEAVGGANEMGRKLLRFEQSIRMNQNRRKRGEQVKEGDVVLKEGERVTPEKVLLLAAVGVREIRVQPTEKETSSRQRRGRVGILTTGKEVLPLSSLPPSTEPSPGQVIDCITPYLSSFLASRGFDPVLFHHSGDSTSAFFSTVASALSLPSSSSSSSYSPTSPPLELLITVAGVSLGVTDHLPSTLSSLGLTQIFHGVAMRPGAPVMLNVHVDSETRGTTPVLSLPGNPMASAVGMRAFGGEVLRMSEGLKGEEGWEEMELPPAGAGKEEKEAWEELAGRVKTGSASFFAMPLDKEGLRPTLIDKEDGRVKTSPCALGSLVKGEAWVRLAAENGKKTTKWCRF